MNRSTFLRSSHIWKVLSIVLLAGLAASIVVAVTFGTMPLPVSEVYQTIMAGPFADESATRSVVWFIRLPRLILAGAVGMGLSVSGVVMQAIVRNPLADPYVLGISSGASLGATMAILLGVGLVLGGSAVGIMGFAGAFIASIVVIVLSNIGGRANSIKLLLAGTAISALCGAFSNFIVYMSDKDDALRAVVNWTMGSLAAAEWRSNAIIWCIILLGTLFFWTQYRMLNLMLLGDEAAITLGADLHKYRLLYIVISALMIGFSVYKAGMIGFVGLVVPHIVRMILGTDHKKLIHVAALSGAIFLIWADVLCRSVIPGVEIPIGILTSLVGAPMFIYLMVRKKYGFGGRD